jgi:hypothetical protein
MVKLVTVVVLGMLMVGCGGIGLKLDNQLYRIDERKEETYTRQANTKSLACLLWGGGCLKQVARDESEGS